MTKYRKHLRYLSFDQFKPDGTIDREKEKAIPEEIIKDEEMKKKYMKAIDECDISGTNH